MATTIEAVYEDGVLRPIEPLPFKNQQRVRLTIEPELSLAERTAGMIKWTGDPAALERIAIDPEFDPQESP